MAGRARARAAGSRRNIGVGPKKQQQQQEPWKEDIEFNNYSMRQAYILKCVTGIGYLALTWSTVVLLGGFVTALGKKDFWCLTAISMIQAAWIFKDWEELMRSPTGRGVTVCLSFICAGISLWRVIQRDYGNMDGDSSKANLMPALDFFYSLILCQGALSILVYTYAIASSSFVAPLRRVCEFPDMWGETSLRRYAFAIRLKFWQNSPSSTDREDRRLVKYAVDLLDSESSQEDYLSGARMLDVLIKVHQVDVRPLILSSTQKVQKLMDTLRWSSSDREIKELAARILAHLACDMDLTQFPGVIRRVSSLLGTATQLPYWNSDQQQGDQQGAGDSQGDGWNELILQGLTILERLASDQHNCTDICGTPDLIAKIMSPIYSDTLIQDINIIPAWQDVVNGAFRVVHQLIRAPEWTGGRRLAHEMSCSEQAVSNLERILHQGNTASQQLQMRAMEILTELALDPSANLAMETKENLINKQLHIFLDEGKEEDLKITAGKNSSDNLAMERKEKLINKQLQEDLRVTAGKTLALLSKTRTLSLCIIRHYNHIVDQVTETNKKATYRSIAAEILENLCTLSLRTMDKNHVKNTLLPKVLTEVLITSKKKPPSGEVSWFARFLPKESQSQIPRLFRLLHILHKTMSKASGDVEENRQQDDEENQRLDGQISSSEQNETQTAMMELKEALLSLTTVIFDSLIISAEDLDDVVREVAPGEGEFVAKLKTIVEENSKATANSLRLVKLCGQIAVTMMRRSQYSAHFKEFVETLSKASGIMRNLESCMLFSGTDCGSKKTARPLLSDLVKEAEALVA